MCGESADGENGSKPLDDPRQNAKCCINFGVRREAGKAETNGAMGDFRVNPHCLEHRRGFKASAAACGAGAGADSLFAEQKQDGFGLQAGKPDVACVRDALGWLADEMGVENR